MHQRPHDVKQRHRSFRLERLLFLAIALGGCSPQNSARAPQPGSPATAVDPALATPADPLQVAAREAPEGERVYLAAAQPVLDTIVARDYAAFYQTLSSHARASSNPRQFVAPTEENARPAADLKNLTVEEFAEWMKKMEDARGVPDKLQQVYVDTVDPKILAGQAEGLDKIEVMYAIGAMPADIPADIRRASLRARVNCQFSDEQVKKLAELQQTTPEAIRQEESELEEEERGTYFNLKFVLVEEEGKLKVGYFEFMPPSMLD